MSNDNVSATFVNYLNKLVFVTEQRKKNKVIITHAL